MSFDALAQPFLKLMCIEADVQRKRLGGDFAVAYLVQTRESRDLCRQLCPNLVFITLTLTQTCQKKRLEGRFGDREVPPFLSRMFEESEPAGAEEENAYNITITEDMTREEVLNKVLEHIWMFCVHFMDYRMQIRKQEYNNGKIKKILPKLEMKHWISLVNLPSEWWKRKPLINFNYSTKTICSHLKRRKNKRAMAL